MVALGTLLSRRQLAGAAALVLLCAGAASAAGGAERYTVEISQMRYGSLPSNLKVGDSLVWVNKDTVPHTVTAKDHSFDLHIDPGKQATLTLAKAGSIAIYCIFHPTMRGTLKVAG
jgi:plastocyanin